MMEKQNNQLRRNFYKWHRILGLIALVPIIFWTVSGLSHPFMSNWFRPFIPEETYQTPALSALKPALNLQQVMDKNHITEVRNFGLVRFNGQTWYQLLQKDSVCNYYSAVNAQLLKDGDRSYATYLARYFTQDSVSKIRNIQLQTKFDGQYQPINHLLPVWKVSFDRADGMDIYIETGQSRMGTFNNNTRKAFLGIFEQFHTWDFLADIFGNQFRLWFMMVIVGVLFLAMLSGIIIYGLFWKRFKELASKRKAKGTTEKRLAHRYHRQLGLIMSFLMLMFFISAGFHLLVKLGNSKPEVKQFSQLIDRSSLQISNLSLPIPDSLVKKQAVVKMFNKVYYQITDNKKHTTYFNAADGQIIPNGDENFAKYLANYYRPQSNSDKKADQQVTLVKQFSNEYGFINKRLPVEQVSFAGNDNWFLETSTAKLATHVAGIDRAEGLSFIFLHKFFWMTWAGKDIRDVVSMLAALSILVAALLGFTAFINNK